MNIRREIDQNLVKFNNKNYIFEKKEGIYTSIKFNDFINKAKALATYLIDNNYKDKTILLIGKNSINYMISDTAITIYTGICVNINRDTKEEDLDDIVKSLNISLIMYTSEQEEKINLMKSSIEKINVDKVIDKVKTIKEEYKDYDENSCTKIIFSSGTTSKPKGVKLSTKNMYAGFNSVQRRVGFNTEDVIYNILPMHHTYSNLCLFYYTFLSGATIYLCSSINNIIEEIKEVNPTVFCGVPLIYERFNEYYKGNVKDAFGNRIRRLYAGGAPLNIDLKNNFRKNGLNLLDTYALTETSSSFAAEYINEEYDGNVGTLYEDMKFKILDPDENGIGEICAKGDAIFLGYTTPVEDIFTTDGYFKTGDLGYIKNNKLYLKGRKKRVLIGSNGENIYVDEISEKLKELDKNINYVTVSLKDNEICVILYLENKDLTDVDKLIELYNSKCTQKNRICKYSVSDKKNYEKLV